MELAICDCCLLLFMEYIDRMTRNLTKLQGGLQQVLPSHNHTNPFAHQASRTPSSHDCPGSQNQRDRLSRLELFRLRGATLPEPITSSRCDKLLRQSFWCLKLSHVFLVTHMHRPASSSSTLTLTSVASQWCPCTCGTQCTCKKLTVLAASPSIEAM